MNFLYWMTEFFSKIFTSVAIIAMILFAGGLAIFLLSQLALLWLAAFGWLSFSMIESQFFFDTPLDLFVDVFPSNE